MGQWYQSEWSIETLFAIVHSVTFINAQKCNISRRFLSNNILMVLVWISVLWKLISVIGAPSSKRNLHMDGMHSKGNIYFASSVSIMIIISKIQARERSKIWMVYCILHELQIFVEIISLKLRRS
jgi:hypothetical protein